jgi:high frequency lysogenization protein
MNKHTQQTLALAGVAQAAFMVHQLSQHGLVAQDKLETAINSLFINNPKSTEEVYGKTNKLNLGLQVIQESLQAKSSLLKSPDVIRYIIGLLYLEKKVSSHSTMLNTISIGLESIEADFLDSNYAANDEAIERLGAIYQNTVSTLSFRIQVKGNMNFLKKASTAAKIRAVLLAGIRSAILWQQLGGKRWHLLFYRKRIARDTTLLLSNII